MYNITTNLVNGESIFGSFPQIDLILFLANSNPFTLKALNLQKQTMLDITNIDHFANMGLIASRRVVIGSESNVTY